jgi:hypothetical protein
LPIRIKSPNYYYFHVRSRFQIILTTPDAHVSTHYPKIQMPNKFQKKKKKGIIKDTKEKTTCKLVTTQASTFWIVSNYVVLLILNNYSKRKVLQSEKLLVEHVNDKH